MEASCFHTRILPHMSRNRKKKDHPRMALIQSHIFSKEGNLSKISLQL